MKGPIQASQRDRQTTFAVALDPDLLRPLTNLKRDQVWGASLELDELDDLGRRIERATTTRVGGAATAAAPPLSRNRLSQRSSRR